MWRFLLLAAFMPIVPTVAEVVDSVSECSEFLLDESPPQVPGILQDGTILNQNRYKAICQTFQNQRRFLTLYDTKNKIPVFSAYKYNGEGNTGRPESHWKIEPQLEDRSTNNMREDRYIHQASNNDYKTDRRYNRGHLFPVCHAFNRNDKKSTFTLTNIVPQDVSFNGGSWQKMETCTKCILQKYCINNNGITEGFVVTGAWPSMSDTLDNTVNIPSMLWTAFCCYSRNRNSWLASAHWGDNIAEYELKYMQTKTLAELHEELSTADSRFEAFPGTQCPLHTTVAEFHPEMDSQCQCPKPATVPTAPTKTTSTTTSTKTEENDSENNENNGGEEGTQEQSKKTDKGHSGRLAKLKAMLDPLKGAVRRIVRVLQSDVCRPKDAQEDVLECVLRGILKVVLRQIKSANAPNDALVDLLEGLPHLAINAP